MPKLTAQRIVSACNKMREELWPLWQRERRLVEFYNGGVLPTDPDDDCDDVPISLGLGFRYIKKPLESLLDVILSRPGFMKADVCYPLKAERKGMVQAAADKEINAIVHDRMESTVRSISGRALITGRGFLFRLSRWDWQFRSGRLLCPLDAPDDIHDDSFREWAFTGRLNLGTIDSLIDSTNRYQDAGGWSNATLKALKRYILKTTVAEKEENRETIIQGMMSRPFGDEMTNNPMEVYWYFRKNGDRNPDGDEKIDLYCVSRWHMNGVIRQWDANGVQFKALQQTGDKEKQQIVYKLTNAFESIDECLIAMILDARIDGEQEMAQVEGTGRIMTPRLQSMEHLTTALLEGIAFGVQPNWTSKTAGAIAPEVLREMQRNGLSPWDYIPPGIEVMPKNNSMQGLNQGMQMMQMLGMSAEADAQTGEMSPQGQSQAKFKAEALMLLQQLGTGLQRRTEKAMGAYDRLCFQIGETFCRLWTLWQKNDVAYYQVRRFQSNMLMLHGIIPAEYSPERIRFTCRRLTGGQDKQTTIQAALATMETWGGMISPSAAKFIGKEAIRALWDDPTAEIAFPDKAEVPKSQRQAAMDQNSTALVDLQIPPREDGDIPKEHLPIHAAALQKRIQLAQQAGSVTMVEREGMSALLMHMTLDVRGLMGKAEQQQIGIALQAAAAVIQKLPITGAQTEMGLKERGQQLKEAQFGFSQQREQNLVHDREQKQRLKQDQFMLGVREHLLKEKSQGIENAGKLLEMMQPAETAELPESENAQAAA